jgi:hypothetical protein
MRIEVLYFEDCPNYLPALDRLRAVLREEGMNVDVVEVEVRDESAAKRLRFIGWPTIRINGLDIDDTGPGLWPVWASRVGATQAVCLDSHVARVLALVGRVNVEMRIDCRRCFGIEAAPRQGCHSAVLRGLCLALFAFWRCVRPGSQTRRRDHPFADIALCISSGETSFT